MQIRTTLSVQNLHHLPARIGSFRRRLSPLNPSTRQSKPTSCSIATHHQPLESVISTKKHLLNLENFLQKQSHDHVNQLDRPVLQYDDEVAKNDGDGSSLAIKGKTLLQGLGRMWPEMKAAEEVSPRHLNRLQRLLSMTQQYSPKNHLGSRWSEYHGSNDWKGLLDPLDENLRREVVRCGEFVQAAYHAFHSNPAMSTKEAPLPQHVALPDRSYKVTKSLYATSSVRLPKWVDDVAPDLGWMTQRTGWVGYVAVCDDKREIQRMGRRDIVISLRGTATCLEWAENMRAHLVDVPENHDQTDDPTSGQAKVECGFLSLYKTSGVHVPSLAETVTEEIKRLMEVYKGETLSITVTGHSLGAALALLVANDLGTLATKIPPIAVFSFGGPKVGNRAFTNQLNAKNVKVLRIVNNQDVITRVPCLPMVEDLNVYSHVGVELCVDTKMSPYLKPNADVACCHDLEAYLHLVDGFVASNCPFRANAKRSLVKLLHDQRSNMKKLYTGKTRAMSLSFRRHGLANSECLPSPSH